MTGVTQKDTWANGKLTKVGVVVILLAVSTLVSQAGVKLVEQNIQKSVSEVYAKAYTGWVSVGSFDSNNQWKSSYLTGLPPNPKDFKSPRKNQYFLVKEDLFLVKENLNGRSKAPTTCSEFDKWLDSEGITIFNKNQLVFKQEVKKNTWL